MEQLYSGVTAANDGVFQKSSMKCGMENKMYQTIFCYPVFFFFFVKKSLCGYAVLVHPFHHKDEQVADKF